MATEVDTWTNAPKADGECMPWSVLLLCTSARSVTELALGLLARSARSIVPAWDGLQAARHASPCAPSKPEPRTASPAALVTPHGRSSALQTLQPMRENHVHF